MGSEHVCACVYVGGVARLLLDPRPPMRERETPPPHGGGTIAGGWSGVWGEGIPMNYFLFSFYLLGVCISCVCVCTCGWHHCRVLCVAGSAICRGLWAFPSRWEGAKRVLRQIGLFSMRGEVAVDAHPHASCVVRGADGGGAGMGCRGSCGAHVRGSRFIVVHHGTSGRLCGAWADGA